MMTKIELYINESLVEIHLRLSCILGRFTQSNHNFRMLFLWNDKQTHLKTFKIILHFVLYIVESVLYNRSSLTYYKSCLISTWIEQDLPNTSYVQMFHLISLSLAYVRKLVYVVQSFSWFSATSGIDRHSSIRLLNW